MKIVEHTSNYLTLKDSAVAVWLTRLGCSPFWLLGCLGLWIVIREKAFPNFFIIFCFVTGLIGVFFTSNKTLHFDKIQNKLSIQIERLLVKIKREYLLNEISLIVKETPFITGTYPEKIYLIILKATSNSQKIRLYFTRNKALEIADEIRIFMNTR